MSAVYITMDPDEILAGLTGFEWDEGNLSNRTFGDKQARRADIHR
jgi:hypothetical protein